MSGWLLGRRLELSGTSVLLLVAFLAGGVILNVMKGRAAAGAGEPLRRVLTGAAAYGVLLLVA